MEKIKSIYTKPVFKKLAYHQSINVFLKLKDKYIFNKNVIKPVNFNINFKPWIGNCKVLISESYAYTLGCNYYPFELRCEIIDAITSKITYSMIKYTAKSQDVDSDFLSYMISKGYLCGFMPHKIGYENKWQLHLDIRCSNPRHVPKPLSFDDVEAISKIKGYKVELNRNFKMPKIEWFSEEKSISLVKKKCIDSKGTKLVKHLIYEGIEDGDYFKPTIHGKSYRYLKNRFKNV